MPKTSPNDPWNKIENKKIQPIFYLVDHGLRKDSKTDALIVKKHLNFQNIHLKILK